VRNRSLFGDVASLFNRSGLPRKTGGAPRQSIFGGPANSMKAQMDAYGSVSTLFSIVQLIAQSTADVEWHLYRKKTDARKVLAPREGDRTELAAHVALDLWTTPNPFYTQTMFIEAVQQHKELTGEMWWVIAFINGTKIPGEIWPVRPDRMQPVPDPDEFVAGYIYTGPGGEKVTLDKEEVIFLKSPNPLDPYRGLGPVQALMTDLDSERYTAEWNRNFFKNDATPGGTIEVPESLNDKELDRLRDQWDENHKGVGNAWRVAVLERGAKFQGSTFTMRDMQFAELRRLSTEKIMEAYRIHGHLLGKSADINRANADAAEYVFSKWLIKQRAGAMKDALNTQLLPKFGALATNVEFDFDDPTSETAEDENNRISSRSSSAKTLIDAGFDPVETLEALGLPKIKFNGKPAAPTVPVQPQLEESVA
jgi:HK97 family phage portal protein